MKPGHLMLALRPRPSFEAVDLGVRMVQSQWRTVGQVYGPAALMVMLMAYASLSWSEWGPYLVVFMAKPWLDRALLLVYSRTAFGQSTAMHQAWVPGVLLGWRAIALSLTTRRLSPWRAFTQAVEQLEGQRGKSAKARRQLLLGGQRFSASSLQGLYSQLESLLTVGLLSLAAWAAPSLDLVRWLQALNAGNDGEIWGHWFTLLYVPVAMLVEPYFVASGFSCYLNRRVELEAWDVEQGLRDAFVR